jgi:hypothetical protein
MRRICCSWLGSKLPLLALAKIAGVKEECSLHWRGLQKIAAGCGLGTIRKLAALICFVLREKGGCWLLCILHGRERSSPSGLPRVEERNIRGRDRSAEKQLAASMNREQAEREEWWRLTGAPSCTCSCSWCLL